MTKQLEFNIEQAGPLSSTLFNIVFDELREYSKNATWAPENLDFQRHHCICDNVVPIAECATGSELMRCTLETEANFNRLAVKSSGFRCTHFCTLARYVSGIQNRQQRNPMKISEIHV